MKTDLSTLNEQQKDAILKSIDHNIVLLAGAGSGKTFTLVKRTEYLISDLGVLPENIMMVTFTNKAAKEIQERMSKLSPDAYKMWIGTFHRICTRLIRKFGYNLGINNFTILDTKDARDIIKDLLGKIGATIDKNTVKECQTKISKFKNNLMTKTDVINDPTISDVDKELYGRYMDYCWQRKSFDFDDLIIYAILLLSTYSEVSDWVHENIRYIMVDECQDTNSAQFTLIKLLSGNNNTLLVGDVNQSIYAFRNAKPAYLENYAENTPNTLKLKLEQNYRSTRNIINAANNVVVNNSFGTKLEMFCDNEDGSKVKICKSDNVFQQAEWIADTIDTGVSVFDKTYEDYAIIYRANYQSSVFEKVLTENGIPYVIFGGTSFYSRKETRDLLAFCKSVINPFDVASFSRMIKTLPRIGDKVVNDIVELSLNNKISLHIALDNYIDSLNKSMTKDKLTTISKFLNDTYTSCSDIVNNIFNDTDYYDTAKTSLLEESQESAGYMEQFLDMIYQYEDSHKQEGLSIPEILDYISLLSYAKGEDKSKQNAVKLMTAHSSKGLEFNNVFIVEAIEGSFPHDNSIAGGDEEIEEERRLFYVAMTRAKKKLYITESKATKKGDSYIPCKQSRFVDEIPTQYKEYVL